MQRPDQRLAGIALALSFYITGAPASGADVILRKVADATTVVPGGATVEFIYSAQPDAGRTVFEADTSAPLNGLWAETAGQIQTVVDTDTPIPGSADRFAAVGEYSQYDGATVFYGEHPAFCDLGPCGGIYAADAGGIALVADTDTPVPGRNGQFEVLDSPVITSGGMAFRGATFAPDVVFGFGVYADLGDGLVTVADWETPTPSGAGTLLFDFFGPRIDIYGSEVYFYATNTEDFQTGYYAWDAATGDYRVLRDAETVVPGTQTTFDTAEGDTFRDGTFAFVGTYGGSPDASLYADFGEGLEEIVNGNELAADWFDGPVDFLTVAASRGAIAFVATDEDQFGDNRLFIYRHADRSLSSILGTGDIVDGRYVNRVEIDRSGLDGESVALIADFKDDFRRELFVATLHAPRHHLLAGPDVDGNGYGELILLRQQPRDRSYELQVRDASSGGVSAVIALGTDPVYDMALLEPPGEPPQAAVYTKNTNGRLLVKIYALGDGALVRSIKLWKDMRPVALAVLPDINGNAAPEVAAMAESPKPFIRVQVIDTATEELLNVLVHGTSLRPVALLAAPDVGGGSSPELVIMGVVRSTNKVRFIVQDGGDATIVGDFFAGFDDKAPVFDAMVTGDVSGDGRPDLVIARQRLAQGKAGYEVRDLLSGANLGEGMRISADRPLHLTSIEDRTGDGRPELGLLRVDPVGASRVEIHDAATQSQLETIGMLAIDDATAVVTTPDIDGNAVEESVVLGRHFSTDMLEIHDVADGTPLRYHFVP